MNQADALNLIQRYTRSLYYRVEPTRTVRGADVPIARGRELEDAMADNVEEARQQKERAGNRWRRAQADGLFDGDAMAGLPKETVTAWITAINVVKGDWQRACAELKHWVEYAQLANEGRLYAPKVSRDNPAGALADIKGEAAE